MEDLGGSLFRTRARDATNVGFTFSFASSFTDADSYTLSNGIAKGSAPIFDDTHAMAEGSNTDKRWLIWLLPTSDRFRMTWNAPKLCT